MELKHTRMSSTILILLCIVINTFAFTVRNGEEQDREGVPIVKPSLWEIFKNGFSLYTTSSPLKVTSYWEKVKMFLQPLHAYVFPPNLDFRVNSGDEARADEPSGGGGAGEKVKKAASKSFGTSKATVEDTAKSAAEVVGETLQKTKEKVKRSFSDREGQQPHQHEL